MCLRLASPPHVVLARLAVRTTASKIPEPKAHVECTAELTEWLAHRIGWARTRRVAQGCCVVVSKGCCDVSAPRDTVFELSTALPPLSKLTIACTSCAFDVGDRPSCPWSRSENWPRSRQDNDGSAIWPSRFQFTVSNLSRLRSQRY
jgi:hypothetical protein